MRKLDILADRFLGRLLRSAAADAACSPRSWKETKTVDGHRCYRYCQLSYDCAITCTAWNCS